jgi:hypothetical protein
MSCLEKIIYYSSYYFFYGLNVLKEYFHNFVFAFPNVINVSSFSDIELSHVYFRPTSEKRKDKNMNEKILISVSHNQSFDWESLLSNTEQKGPFLGDTLEVHYTVPYEKKFRKSYIIAYKYPAKIEFPPYSLKQIHDYHHSEKYKPAILHAEINSNDITNEVEKWVGPLDNFYSDIPFRKGVYFTKELVVGSNSNPLHIINSKGEEYTL